MRSTTIFSSGTLLALIAALFSGTNNFIAKIGVTVVSDPVLFTTLKNLVTVLLLIGAVIMFRKWKEFAKLKRADVRNLLLVGVIGGALPFGLFFTGLSMVGAVTAGLIHKTLVIWVALLAYPLLKERVHPLAYVGIGSIVLANFFFGGMGRFSFSTGEILVLLATLCWAIENIIAKKTLATVSPLLVTSARMTIGAVLLFVYLALQSRLAPAADLSWVQWGWTALSGVLLFGFVLSWYSALRRAPATYVAALLVPATMVTSLLSAVFITHTISTSFITGTILTLIGLGLLIRYARTTAGILTDHGRLRTQPNA